MLLLPHYCLIIIVVCHTGQLVGCLAATAWIKEWTNATISDSYTWQGCARTVLNWRKEIWLCFVSNVFEWKWNHRQWNITEWAADCRVSWDPQGLNLQEEMESAFFFGHYPKFMPTGESGWLILEPLHWRRDLSRSTLFRLESWSSDPSPGYAAIGPPETKVSHCQPNSPLRYPGMDLPRKAEECDPPVVRAYSPGTRDGSHPPPTPCRQGTCRPPHPRVHLRVPIELHSTGASNLFFQWSLICYEIM